MAVGLFLVGGAILLAVMASVVIWAIMHNRQDGSSGERDG